MQEGVPNMRQRPLTGPANHVWQVFRELTALGHEMCLLMKYDGRLWVSHDLITYKTINVRGERGPIRWLEKLIRWVQSILHLPYFAFFDSVRFALACHQELAECDLLYERMGWMGYGGGLAARWLKVPLIWEVNGDHLSEMRMLGIAPTGWQRWVSLMVMNRAVHHVTHVVAAGDGWRTRFIEQWSIAPQRVSVVENGTTLMTLLPKETLRAWQTAVSHPLTIAFIGRFQPWQGLTQLIKAVAGAMAQGVSLQVIIIGVDDKEPELQQLVAKHQLTTCIVWAGYLTPAHYAPLLATADVGVSAYCGRVEYSGLKLLDYKAAGLATIASGQAGQPRVIADGRTGLIVPPCDEEALCQAILYLSENRALCKQMGRVAREEAEKQHRWRDTAVTLDQLFRELVKL